MQKRPTWRRLAGDARSAVYRIATLVDRVVRWRSDALVPPAHLRVYYYRIWSTKAFTRAGEMAVFTHMLPDAVEHYLHEISRLLAPDGVCVASYFLLNDETRTGVDQGHSFMTFSVQHPSGLCRLHDATIPEAAVAIEEMFVRRIHDEGGLRIRDIRRGRWWSGEADDQDVLAVVRDPDKARHIRR